MGSSSTTADVAKELASLEVQIEAILRERAELLAALKEMRELAGACFRVIYQQGNPDDLVAECARIGLANGAGARADAVIVRAEGQP